MYITNHTRRKQLKSPSTGLVRGRNQKNVALSYTQKLIPQVFMGGQPGTGLSPDRVFLT